MKSSRRGRDGAPLPAGGGTRARGLDRTGLLRVAVDRRYPAGLFRGGVRGRPRGPLLARWRGVGPDVAAACEEDVTGGPNFTSREKPSWHEPALAVGQL